VKMRRLRLVLIVLIAFVLGLVLYFHYARGNKIYSLNKVKFNFKVIPQKAGRRTWHRVELKDSITFFPFWGGIRVDDTGNVYAWDYNYRLNKFSPSGELLVKIGKGRGKGPGEFTLPLDVAIDEEGKIWICDGATNLVQVFKSDGSLYKVIRLQTSASKIRVLNPDTFVVMKSIPSDYLFEIYDIDGRLLKKLGSNLIHEQSKFPLVLSGSFDVEDGFLYLTFHYLGFIVCYDIKSGDVRYVVETMDRNLFPKIQVSGQGGKGVMRIAEDSEIASLDVVVSDGKIYVRSGSGLKERAIVLDVYSAIDGRYLYSFRFNKFGFLKGKFFYEQRDTILVKWLVFENG